MTKKQQVIFILLQTVSIIGFVALGLYVYSFFEKPQMPPSYLGGFLAMIFSALIGLLLPLLIYLKQIGGFPNVFKSAAFGILGLITGVLIYVVILILAGDYLSPFLRNALIPGFLGYLGLITGSYLGIRKRK